MFSGDFASALTEFFGSSAGLSPSVITRLTTQRRLDDRDYVYVWADGVHLNVRLEDDRLCCVVAVGVRIDIGHPNLVLFLAAAFIHRPA